MKKSPPISHRILMDVTPELIDLKRHMGSPVTGYHDREYSINVMLANLFYHLKKNISDTLIIKNNICHTH